MKNMNIFSAVVLFVMYAHHQVLADGIVLSRSSQLQKECAKTLGSTSSGVSEKLKAEDFQYQYKCFLKCVAEKFELMSEGKLNQEKVEGYLNRLPGVSEEKLAKYKEDYAKCKDIKVEDACETASKLYDCGKIVNPELLALLSEFITVDVNAGGTLESKPVE